MPEDRRNARRARLSGVRVTYESATGDVHEADVANLSRDGIFIASLQPLAVGKRLTLELLVAGETGAWAALGRVIWIRTASEGEDLPAGMAIKIIDIEESVAIAIDRLIETREQTEPGLGGAGPAPPVREKTWREKTMIGVGVAVPKAQSTAPAEAPPVAAPAEAAPVAAPPPPTAPVARVLPSREKTVLGVGRSAAGADPREPSVAIDLVAKKLPSSRPPPASDKPAGAPATTPTASDLRESEEAADRRLREFEKAAGPADEITSDAPAPPRRSGLGWWVLLVILAACGASAYAFRDRLLPLWQNVVTEILKRVR
jgi:hypothetical protein